MSKNFCPGLYIKFMDEQMCIIYQFRKMNKYIYAEYS